jgi:hypothetical protein
MNNIRKVSKASNKRLNRSGRAVIGCSCVFLAYNAAWFFDGGAAFLPVRPVSRIVGRIESTELSP